ncbi:MAG TPA: prolipoprotein diacylglyceryl transferase family protein [Solirubrobacterales bacterium]|nr:prolipoprotein diacylglyceryl transferase family protein [Solirubrobacterales bacterium]
MSAVTWSYLGFWAGGELVGLVSGAFILRARRVLTPATFGALVIAWCGLAIGARWQQRLEYLPVLTALRMSPHELFEPGTRLPLGLVTGAALAGLWCVLFRAPWRDVGDALAVAASVLIPIGRLGCIANGCCMGAACRRFGLFCMRYSPGTEAYSAQLQQNLISPGAPLSLPAHPLPVYFAVASLLTLAVLLWLFRRGAPAGAMLATFCILQPLSKLALEPLRAVPRPGPLMLAIPATELIVTCTVLAVMLVRRGAARTESQARVAPEGSL